MKNDSVVAVFGLKRKKNRPLLEERTNSGRRAQAYILRIVSKFRRITAPYQ